MDGEEKTLATEILHELKMSAKRWFIAFILMIGIEIATVCGFLWYMSLPAEEVAIQNGEGNANYIGNDMMGDINNGKNYNQKKNG